MPKFYRGRLSSLLNSLITTKKLSKLPLIQVHSSTSTLSVSMMVFLRSSILITNLLLTEREGRTGEYWPEVVAIRTERSEVRTKTTEGQYPPVRLELARLVSSLLYGTRTMLVLSLPAFENKKIHSLCPFLRKRSVWRNPDQERTNQNARIYLTI